MFSALNIINIFNLTDIVGALRTQGSFDFRSSLYAPVEKLVAETD